MIEIIKIKPIILFTILLLCCSACVEDDESPQPAPSPKYTEIDVLTGLDLYDANGSPISKWKEPNNKPGDVRVFPNPNNGIFIIQSSNKITRIVMISASCITDSTTMNIQELSAELNFSFSDAFAKSVLDLETPDFGNSIQLDATGVLPEGFYRIFIQLESGEVYWENTYIDPQANNFPGFDFLDDLCD